MRWNFLRRKHEDARVMPNPLDAGAKANAQLNKSLSPFQRISHAENQQFRVTSIQSGRAYVIYTSHAVQNICCLDNGRIYCCHLSPRIGEFPRADHILAQALMIRFSEDEFLRIAF